ncbi:MAG: acyl-CoA dehydrogenase family protein [Acidobacteriota bacterium]
MSHVSTANDYSFDDFLTWRQDVDYYADDPFVQSIIKHFSGKDWPEVDAALREFSRDVSFRYRDIADRVGQVEERPRLRHFDAHNHRIDRLERPAELVAMEREVLAGGLFSNTHSPWTYIAKMFLLSQNGEACLICPIVCTEGLVALLDRFADTTELEAILAHCRDGVDQDFAVGAQYVTEIQGGSDIPSNRVEAIFEDGAWRLYGKKFFCSATHADYAVVTARPAGSDKLALFVVPSWLPGDKVGERRNHHTIDRIKDKMGTRELPTAEISFDGAIAFPTGPLDRGVANVVGIVLTRSRLIIGLNAAAFLTRAAREARNYAQFRTAFGRKIADFPMLAGQLDELETAARRTTAASFKLYREFMEVSGSARATGRTSRDPGGSESGEQTTQDARMRAFAVRQLIMLQKATAASDATTGLRLAMSVFGGHGVMEDFSSLPRLFRDAAVNELWEGPRNVLLSQLHRDFRRAAEWCSAEDFIAFILEGAETAVTVPLARDLGELTAEGSIDTPGEGVVDLCRRWDRFCDALFHAYQDRALVEVADGAAV